ncbi:dipeptidase PepV [Bacillus hwajinpoensis]|uniref:Dipeptidase PepV n=1 Tax=Guptibacillus hwajinpoensis TaxID=208199 RepID=A0A845EVU8_9BACL|nr:dipeptidase PepV [Pseudalkalibacillus hwajinpoensis]MYL62708.1 dipeptidase PepV [Pseudalkalibacillus hwajinpoensis]
MNDVNWKEEVLSRKQSLMNDLEGLLKIESVLDEENRTEDAPFGSEVKKALDYMLNLGKRDGYQTKNVEQVAGHLEFGQGEDIIGILCHVDVVPAGNDWTTPPFTPDVREGKMYARGAIDDKGPTIAAYWAMNIVKELYPALSKRVRMIVGTDEESSWRCVDTYFKHEEMPTMGFAPDAVFPIIHAEKGIADFEWIFPVNEEKKETFFLCSFHSGQRLNMVPDHAIAKCQSSEDQLLDVKKEFELFLNDKNLKGKATLDKQLTLEIHGVSVHGSAPHEGVNAAFRLAEFLEGLSLDQNGSAYINFITKWLQDDFTGERLGVSFKDNITGSLTMNAGTFEYQASRQGRIGINLRYPVTCQFDHVKQTFEKVTGPMSVEMKVIDHMTPHHVPQDHELIQKLQHVYEKQTGKEAKLLSIGGGTYARSLNAGVAFGALFEGKPQLAHQKDEYVDIEDLLKAAAIYAEAIYELAK